MKYLKWFMNILKFKGIMPTFKGIMPTGKHILIKIIQIKIY